MKRVTYKQVKPILDKLNRKKQVLTLEEAEILQRSDYSLFGIPEGLWTAQQVVDYSIKQWQIVID